MVRKELEFLFYGVFYLKYVKSYHWNKKIEADSF